jgi:DNA-binding MarR family transcriptional regulator
LGFVRRDLPPMDGAMEAPPLARLFAIAARSLVDDLHERLAVRGWRDVRQYDGYVLLAARDVGIRSSEVSVLMGITKQAASKQVDSMVERGLVRRQVHPDDRRAKLVTLSPRGRRLLVAVEEIYVELEQRWAAILGFRQLQSLRDDLVTVLNELHGGRLPPVRPM